MNQQKRCPIAKYQTFLKGTIPLLALTKIDKSLDVENMDKSPQTNYHIAYSEALDTPNLAASSLSVTSLID